MRALNVTVIHRCFICILEKPLTSKEIEVSYGLIISVDIVENLKLGALHNVIIFTYLYLAQPKPTIKFNGTKITCLECRYKYPILMWDHLQIKQLDLYSSGYWRPILLQSHITDVNCDVKCHGSYCMKWSCHVIVIQAVCFTLLLLQPL